MPQDIDDFLMHHGIKGMHWGHHKARIDTPSSSRTTASTPTLDRKVRRKALAAPYHQKAEEAKKQLEELHTQGLRSPLMTKAYPKGAEMSNIKFYVKYGVGQKKAILQAKNELVKKQKWAEANAKAYDEGRLTPKQKKAILGASVVIGAVVAIGILNGLNTRAVARNAAIDSRALTSHYAGGKVSYDQFMKDVRTSQRVSWGKAHDISRIGATNLSDIDIRVPQGTQFHRVSTKVEKTVMEGAYATHLHDDVLRYRAAFSNEKGGQPLHSTTIDTLEDVVSPSLKKRVQSFIEILDENHADSVGPQTGRDILARKIGVTGKEAEWIKSAPATAVGEKYYHTVAGGNFRTDPLSKAFADKVRSKGYNAIIDDMDAGVYGDQPMVLLNAAAFKVANSQPLTKEMINEARDNLTEIIGRKT